MSDYTPTTKLIRKYWSSQGIIKASTKARRIQEFDKWITDYRHRQQSIAWDACGQRILGDAYETSEFYLMNPYRGEK